ncbi:MAG: FkbM family methyltransferase [Gammaproteobacteria bacterium]|nr:FkbM family methyltransferase [Gammaproteobacteria bacterium]NNL62336.1 FkbM family methyltransferase [Woeseiaceae bacterium]
MRLSPFEKLHMIHRCWRLRFKSEVPSIRYVRTAPLAGSTVLDIGANKGVFSIYMSRAAGPGGKLIAFEAQPELGEHLRAVRQSFGLTNMTVVNQGLSSSPGTLVMHRSEAGSGMASFHKDDSPELQSIDISVIRLDDYVDEHGVGPVRFIKCDVEGHELEVFRGAERTLRRDMPTLLFECHDDEADRGELFGFLAGLGYAGRFFHVTQADHRSLLHKGRGEYVPCERRDDYPHVHPSVRHRNYLFDKKAS